MTIEDQLPLLRERIAAAERRVATGLCQPTDGLARLRQQLAVTELAARDPAIRKSAEQGRLSSNGCCIGCGRTNPMGTGPCDYCSPPRPPYPPPVRS